MDILEVCRFSMATPAASTLLILNKPASKPPKMNVDASTWKGVCASHRRPSLLTNVPLMH